MLYNNECTSLKEQIHWHRLNFLVFTYDSATAANACEACFHVALGMYT